MKNQYIYKLRGHSNYFVALILAQIIAAVLFFGGILTSSYGNNSFHIFHSGLFIAFTVLWAVCVSVLLTTKQSRSENFTLPGNRISNYLSDIAFMLTGCLFGGVTSTLLGMAIRLPVFIAHMGWVMEKGFYPDMRVMLIICADAMLYLLLYSAGGYFVGMLAKLSKWFYVVIAAFFLSFMFLVNSSAKSQTFLRACFESIAAEKSLGMFTVKVVMISAILLFASAVISSHMEVRK